MKCGHCGKKIPEGSEFCLYCGKKQEIRFCYKCGGQIPPDSEFCQFCGSTQPKHFPEHKKTHNKQQPAKKGLIIGIITVVAITIAAIVIFVVIKPFNQNTKTDTNSELNIDAATKSDEKSDDATTSTAIEEIIASSQSMSISYFKERAHSLIGNYVHLSGYIYKNDGWEDYKVFVIVEKQQWPYDFTPIGEYYGDVGSHERGYYLLNPEGRKKWDEYKAVDKTPSLLCAFKGDDNSDITPYLGDYVDIYGIPQSEDRIAVYYISVD